MARWRVGVDVGGTFTDVALVEETTGRLVVRKVATVASDPAEGVVTGVEKALRETGVRPDEVVYFGAGSTVALNTIIQRVGVKTGLLVTKGFRDVLELRRTRLPDAPSFEARRPIPLVRRALVREVEERVKADGSVLRPLAADTVLEAAASLVDAGVEALAICFLHSYANPTHERMAAALVSERWPELFVCASSDIWPQEREYERALVTVMNAYVGPTMRAYYRRLEESLRGLGIQCPILVTQSNGGAMSIEDAAALPVRTILSGPAAGVMAAAKTARESRLARLFTLDMGGTSADMAVIAGEPSFSTESGIGDYPLFMPAVAINTIGAGGGSIAWVDDQGVLKVGPQSAGAVPGPACYNRGGTEPTVTDAYLLTGILGPEGLLDGQMPLSLPLAEAALGRLGARLGLTALEVAQAVIRIATANMYAEFLPLVARHGVDQRDFVLVPFGGAGPTHAFLLAEEAGLRHVFIPRAPGAMCALGAALVDLQMDFVRTVRAALSDPVPIEVALADMEQDARRWLSDQGLPPEQAHFTRSADMRYVGQSYELTVGLAHGADPRDLFHRRYEQVYGYHDPQSPIEVLQLRLLARVPNPVPGLGLLNGKERPPASRPSHRRPLVHGGQRLEVPVYRRADLVPNERLAGPAVVTQYDTTIFVTPGFDFWLDGYGNIRGEAR